MHKCVYLSLKTCRTFSTKHLYSSQTYSHTSVDSTAAKGCKGQIYNNHSNVAYKVKSNKDHMDLHMGIHK